VVRGRGGTERERAVYKTPEKVQGTKRRRKSDLMIVEAGTDPLKDEVIMSLTRKDSGPGKYHLPDQLADTVFAEFCAEARTESGWREVKSGLRNEALDLAVYGKALTIVLKAERINWERPPAWALAGPENSYAVPIEGGAAPAKRRMKTPKPQKAEAEATPPKQPPTRQAPPAQRTWINRPGGNWFSR